MSGYALDDKGIVLSCPSCEQRNRMNYGRLGETFRCPKCQAALPFPNEPVQVDDARSFAAMIQHSAVPVLVDFWAEWCGPCKMMAPELAKVALTAGGQFLIAKVNTEELPELGRQFQIMSIPLLVLFSEGREIQRSAGARPASQIQQFVRSVLNLA